MKSKQDYLWEGLLCNVIYTPYGAWIPVHRHWTWNACSDVNDCFHCPATELLIDALSQNNVENTSAFDDVTPLTLAEFNQTCTSPTTKLWLMYMDMVMILKRCIHTERAGLWEEYLAELENMLLYLVAYGRCKYVSCLPYYLEAMIGLPILALNNLKAFKMDRSLDVKQKLCPMVSRET